MITNPDRGADERRLWFLLFGLWGSLIIFSFWAVYNIAAGEVELTGVLICSGVGNAVLLLLRKRARHTFVVKTFWALSTVQVGIFAGFLLGPKSNVHFYFLVAGIFPLMLLPVQGNQRFLVSALFSSWLLLFLAQLSIIDFAPLVDLPPGLHAASRGLNVGIALLFLAFYVGLFIVDSLRAEKELTIAHAEADRLLLNVLPAEIAERLKAGEATIADEHAAVTVLFSDLVGFTELSEKLSPEAVVRMLNELVTDLDRLTEERGLEKIKTIGDAYMAAGGLDDAGAEAVACRVVDLAVAMRDCVASHAERREHDLAVRIGIHTGPVVAGVIGELKFTYDIWGDTVNIAARMESHGLPGEIQVSDATQKLLGDAYRLERRGAIEVKGKGQIETWLLRAPS